MCCWPSVHGVEQGLPQNLQWRGIPVLRKRDEADLKSGKSQIRQVERTQCAGGDMGFKRPARHADKERNLPRQQDERIGVGRQFHDGFRAGQPAISKRGLDGNASNPERALRLGQAVPQFAQAGLDAAKTV